MTKEQLRAATLLLEKQASRTMPPSNASFICRVTLHSLANVCRELAELEEPATVANPVTIFRALAREILAPLPMTIPKLSETLDKLSHAAGQAFVPHSELNKRAEAPAGCTHDFVRRETFRGIQETCHKCGLSSADAT